MLRNIAIAVLTGLAMISASYADDSRFDSFEKRESCIKNNGIWREFGNSCSDFCSTKFSKFRVCASVITYGCDCSDNGCFDQKTSSCRSIEDARQEYEFKKKQQEDKIRQEREARKLIRIQHQRKVMKDLLDRRSIPLEDQNRNGNSNQDPAALSRDNLSSFFNKKQMQSEMGGNEFYYLNKITGSRYVAGRSSTSSQSQSNRGASTRNSNPSIQRGFRGNVPLYMRSRQQQGQSNSSSLPNVMVR